MVGEPTGDEGGPAEAAVRPSILIVDDENLMANALATRLRFDGVDTAIAGTIAEARLLCHTRFFHAAFIDLKLPDGRGTDFAASCKAIHPNTLVILMSGFALGSDDPSFYGDAVDMVLPKPWRPAELQAILQTIL